MKPQIGIRWRPHHGGQENVPAHGKKLVMFNDNTFIGEERRRELQQFAERVADRLRAAGLPVMLEDEPWESGGVHVKVSTFTVAPGVFLAWRPSAALQQELSGPVLAENWDDPTLLRYAAISEAMEQALAKVVSAFGLGTRLHDFEDESDRLEVLEPTEQQEPS